MSEIETEISEFSSDVNDYADVSDDDFEAAANFELSDALSPSEIYDDNFTYSSSALGQVDLKPPSAFKSMLRKLTRPAAVLAAVLFVIAAVIYAIGIISLPEDTVMHNVYVGDINLSGMTYDEAFESIKQEYTMNDPTVTLCCGGQVYEIKGSDIGMSANPEDTAKRAFDYGKNGNRAADGFKNALRFFKKREIMPAVSIDHELLIIKINDFGLQLYGKMINHYVEINETDTTADVHPGCTGYDPDSPESYTDAADAVLNAINKNRYSRIYVSLSESSPEPLTVDQFDGAVYRDPEDAQYIAEDNSVTVAPEVNGRYIDKAEAEAYLTSVYEGGEIVKIPYYISYAAVTESELLEKLFADTLASYSTNFGGSTSNRAANVSRAAELINGKVLMPGETFSFNDTVGLRTVANGFHTATEYVNGESVEGIGGGTCQVSTTLYSAVLYADLQIVHRECHMMSVGYAPLGQDATVADNSVDFQFKNTTDYPIKISSYTEGRTLYVSIIGTAWDPERTVELKHSASMSGENTVVHSTRYVYSNGELISTDPLGQSVYRPHKSSTT